MYEGFYEKSSGYAMAAGMLLNTMSLLHANDNSVQADEGAKGTTQEQEHSGYSKGGLRHECKASIRVENDKRAVTPNEKTNAAAPNTAAATSAGMLLCTFTVSGAGIAVLYK